MSVNQIDVNAVNERTRQAGCECQRCTDYHTTLGISNKKKDRDLIKEAMMKTRVVCSQTRSVLMQVIDRLT